MRQLDDRAWGILSDEEQTAISLQHVHLKSTWEAGEIMQKAHYKYLEIKARAEKFLKIFTLYFQEVGVFIKTETISPIFITYLHCVMIDRIPLKEARIKATKGHPSIHKAWQPFLEKEMAKLVESQDEFDEKLLHLILDFDRWNSHRILPMKYQEPSAYKRRHKNRYKHQIKVMTELSPFIVNLIRERYSTEDREFCLYLPIVYGDYSNHRILKIANDPETIAKISSYGLYLFEMEENAEAFIEIIQSYDLNNKQDCKVGQIFWPKYRVCISLSLNQNIVERVIPSRDNLDEVSLPGKRIDEVTLANKQKRKKKRS